MRVRTTIALVVLVATAGCLGGVPSDTSEGPPDAAWAEGEGLDTTRLADRHFEALREAGGFTVNHTEIVRVDGDARPGSPRPEGYHPPTVARHRVDLDDNRSLDIHVTVGGRRSTHFTGPRVEASRRKPCPSCAYEYTFDRRPALDTRAERIDRYRRGEVVESLARLLRGVTVGFNYTYAGTVARDGETFHRYTASKNLTSAPPPFAEPPRGTATVLVTDDGVIRRFELSYAGTATVESRSVPVTHTFVRTYTGVGETTVDRPAWVERARGREEPRRTERGTAR